MNRIEFSKKMWELGDRTTKASEEYANIANKLNIKTQEDVNKLKSEWLAKVKDFRLIQSEMEDTFIRAGLEDEAKEVNESYAKYVGYIEEKSVKFSVETMKSGELDKIQKLETEEAKNFSRLIKELTDKIYD